MTTRSRSGHSAPEADALEIDQYVGCLKQWTLELEDGAEVFIEAYDKDIEVAPGDGPLVRLVADRGICIAYTPTEALEAAEEIRRSPVLTAANRTDIAATLGCREHGPFLTVHEVEDLAEALTRAALLAAEGAARARSLASVPLALRVLREAAEAGVRIPANQRAAAEGLGFHLPPDRGADS